jgi:hypothetical protein|tara:strand:+ start:137 stop:658 length:522 start_codon:yes stop_codon:yes gene_type:complete
MYTKKVEYKNHERPAKINMETGEIIEVSTDIKKDRRNEGRIFFNASKGLKFTRRFEDAWSELDLLTNDSEYLVAIRLADLAKAFSSSLEPLNDDTSILELSKVLNKNRRAIKKILDKLFKLGVYAKFAVSDKNYKEKKYWVFNPYLSFNGTHILEDTLILFKDTRFAPDNLNR